MRRILVALGIAGIVAAITAGVVFAQNYEGEDFCQDTPSWPNGTYLGQMHPYHSDFYRGFAERRGWDPCVTWAQDQRNSAIRGIRELGYTVTEPEGGATPPGPSATASAPASSLSPVSLDRYFAVGGGHASAASVALSASVSENYEGENFCKDTPSWPNGTYLGQMHPFHSSFYRGFAERRGWDPCVTWAQDQRNSAIRGLRELGYIVIEPEGGAPPPGRVVTPFVDTSSLPMVGSALFSAVWKGETDRVRRLVAGGATVNARTADGDPLIHQAVWREHVDIVQILVDAGAHVNVNDANGDPVILQAIWRDYVDVLQILVDAGADVDAADADGHPVLREAIWRDRVDVVRILVHAGADIDAKNADGDPLLHEAVGRGRTEIVRILAEAGVDVNAPDTDGRSPLYKARIYGHAEIERILIECGAT
ncbi:MAG: ankyrin repeat domain-containing protein [Chloroflexi bacterium]|nr:ankyrin repeat domain-containing protein [Chloroflexota bacterium]